jgi:hypothetical protein
MKITKKQLQRIVQEELGQILQEDALDAEIQRRAAEERAAQTDILPNLQGQQSPYSYEELLGLEADPGSLRAQEIAAARRGETDISYRDTQSARGHIGPRSSRHFEGEQVHPGEHWTPNPRRLRLSSDPPRTATGPIIQSTPAPRSFQAGRTSPNPPHTEWPISVTEPGLAHRSDEISAYYAVNARENELGRGLTNSERQEIGAQFAFGARPEGWDPDDPAGFLRGQTAERSPHTQLSSPTAPGWEGGVYRPEKDPYVVPQGAFGASEGPPQNIRESFVNNLTDKVLAKLTKR